VSTRKPIFLIAGDPAAGALGPIHCCAQCLTTAESPLLQLRTSALRVATIGVFFGWVSGHFMKSGSGK